MLLSKQRMEALTDGVFAIAMTLLVLELRVPEAPRSIASMELLHKLEDQLPALFSFLVSFLYCGVLWILHHLAVHFFRHIQASLAWMNLLFLFAVSLLPFSCALLGHFLKNQAAEEIYFGNLFLAALLLLIQWWLAKQKNLLNDDDPRSARDIERRLTILPPALAASALATAYKPMSGFYVLALVMLGMRIWRRMSGAMTPNAGTVSNRPVPERSDTTAN